MKRDEAERINDCWSMEFVSDDLFDGCCLQLLTRVDSFTRESVAIEVDRHIRGDDVVRVLTRVATNRGLPTTIRVDNGPEFISKSLDQWAHWNKVTLDFSCPGKPTDKAFIESFNGRLREECLNENWFLSIENAKKKVESWRCEYTEVRPHGSLGNLAPNEFAQSGQVNLA